MPFRWPYTRKKETSVTSTDDMYGTARGVASLIAIDIQTEADPNKIKTVYGEKLKILQKYYLEPAERHERTKMLLGE